MELCTRLHRRGPQLLLHLWPPLSSPSYRVAKVLLFFIACFLSNNLQSWKFGVDCKIVNKYFWIFFLHFPRIWSPASARLLASHSIRSQRHSVFFIFIHFIGMHFKTIMESIAKLYWNAFQNSIGKHRKTLLECISKLYWKASQNFIWLHFETLLESIAKLYWNAFQNFIGNHLKAVGIVG